MRNHGNVGIRLEIRYASIQRGHDKKKIMGNREILKCGNQIFPMRIVMV